jgi:hypothetical protein
MRRLDNYDYRHRYLLQARQELSRLGSSRALAARNCSRLVGRCFKHRHQLRCNEDFRTETCKQPTTIPFNEKSST